MVLFPIRLVGFSLVAPDGDCIILNTWHEEESTCCHTINGSSSPRFGPNGGHVNSDRLVEVILHCLILNLTH